MGGLAVISSSSVYYGIFSTGNGISDEYHVIRHVMNLESVNTYEGEHSDCSFLFLSSCLFLHFLKTSLSRLHCQADFLLSYNYNNFLGRICGHTAQRKVN